MANTNKAVAFMFYPDKFQAGTRHLSDKGRRAYMDVMCWMWLHSQNQYSMSDTEDAWIGATGLRGVTLAKIRKQIQAPHHKMFKEQRGKLVCNGLKKERKKQIERRKKAQLAANAKWGKDKDRC